MEVAKNSSPSSSPEFEFWMVGNTPTLHPSQPRILTADELFSDGVLLPLHQLSLLPPPSSTIHHHHHHHHHQGQEQQATAPTKMTTKWKEVMLKVGGDEKRRRIREAELRIHIWPFMRSSSAGRAGLKLDKNSPATSTRRVSSAPCSRSNSRGEPDPTHETQTTTLITSNNNNNNNNKISSRLHARAKARVLGLATQINNNINNNNSNKKGSMGGGGIHLNRPGLMWKLRRSGRSGGGGGGGGGGGDEEKSGDGNKKVLNFNVKTCVGYESGGSNGGLVKLKAFFSKKLH